MFEKFTDRARTVFALANQEAQRFNHDYIGPEHVLLGLIKEGSGVAAWALKNSGIDFRKVRLEVEKRVKSCPEMVTMGRIPQTPQTKEILSQSIEEARHLNNNYVGTEHILLGLLKVESIACDVLRDLGVSLDQMRSALINLFTDNKQENDQQKLEMLDQYTLDRVFVDLLAKFSHTVTNESIELRKSNILTEFKNSLGMAILDYIKSRRN